MTIRVNNRNLPVHHFFAPRDGDVYAKIPVDYARAEIDGPARVEITPPVPPVELRVSARREIDVTRTETTLAFSVDAAGPYLVHGDTWRLLLFCDAHPYQMPDIDDDDVFLPDGPDTTGSVRCTDILQQAIDRAGACGGKAVIPAGTYLTGTLFMRSNMTLHIDRDAVLLGTTEMAEYPDVSENISPTLHKSLDPQTSGAVIMCDSVRNARITGRGIVDGQGDAVRATREGRRRNLNLLRIRDSRNVLVDGVALCNPLFWNSHVLRSENVVFRNLPVINEIPPRTWSMATHGREIPWNNTDGINPDASRNVVIESVFAYCGDDCVPVKCTNSSPVPAESCENITVRDCLFYTPCTAMKIGTESVAESMRNMTFEEIKIVSAGCAIGAFVKDNACVRNITFRDIVVEWCSRPVLVELSPRTEGQTEHASAHRLLFSGIEFRDVREPFELKGFDAAHDIRGVVIKNVTIGGTPLADESSPHLVTNEFVRDMSFA